jgi:selenoprotein W-related protein
LPVLIHPPPAGETDQSAEAASIRSPNSERENAVAPRVEIQYCRQCRWLMRASWMAQELLTTFESELGEVALVPGTGGVFEVRVDGEMVFSRTEEGRFPESKELKQRVRDRIAPDKPLGHSDRE